ncbi:hypothetical protein GCM10023311_28140 [Flaviramulus aquimarinus]|uniref:Tail specific protease domain-containing protein n=2 Tax=Flaviramulus aquimarinus TaxID=1170456 RepID=A0ABP9FGF4_9FLAO
MTISCKKKQDTINNLKTFAKAYGYVKYFHPSDEASAIDWNSFAAYGAEQIVKCQSKTEVINTLNSLFKPIAPSVVFSEEKQAFNLNTITPESPENFKPTYWQHKGVSKDMTYQNYVYSSVRVNRYSEIDESSNYGNISMSINAKKYRGKEIKYTGWVKLNKNANASGHLSLWVENTDRSLGFYETMDAKPIKSSDWKPYEIIGKIDTLGSKLAFGSYVSGKGTLYLDDVHLYYKDNNEWVEIPIKNSDFEASSIGEKTEQSEWIGKSKGYTYNVSSSENMEGKNCLVISYEGAIKKVKGEAIFKAHPKFGELIEEEIGKGIYCQIPLNLFGDDKNTFPKSKIASTLQDSLKVLDNSPENLAMRIGNFINTYNVIQHFYPYFEEAETNWDKALETALKQSFSDQTADDHLITLQKFMAPLKDGHVRVWMGNAVPYVPAINWEWVEDKLIITEVKNDTLNIKVGDIVTKIDKQLPKNYFEDINSRISAGTKGSLDFKAQDLSLFGKKDSKLVLEVNGKTINLKRDKNYTYTSVSIPIQKNKYKLLDNNIFYLNLDTIEMDTITSLMPQLKTSKGIICDMRGYPNSNHDFISHLLKENDTSKAWLRIPKIIYPNQNKIVGYEDTGWEIETKEPYLGDKKIVFIIDSRAISYAESYMSFIEGYKLATIVGQPTAGTNGNINPFKLLGNFNVNWTGMKVIKHDGSQHHAIGILPNIYVNKTIEGVKSGKDEFLEKAIQVVLEQ